MEWIIAAGLTLVGILAAIGVVTIWIKFDKWRERND